MSHQPSSRNWTKVLNARLDSLVSCSARGVSGQGFDGGRHAPSMLRHMHRWVFPIITHEKAIEKHTP